MKIEYKYTRQSDKFFVKHEDIRNDFKRDIARLVNNNHPELVNVKRLKGNNKKYFSIAIDSYHIIYTIIHGDIVVIDVILAGNRGDIYKKLH